MKLRLIIAGGRDFKDYGLLEHACKCFIYDLCGEMHPDPENILCVSGGARGADSLGERFAIYHGYKRKQFIANWHGLGNLAGPFRNIEMAEYVAKPLFLARGGVPALIAFWDGKSNGTKHMIKTAENFNITTKIIPYGAAE